MNTAILQPEIQKFIREFKGDISKLAFAGSPFPEVTTRELLEQIDSRQKIRDKLPTWFATPNIYYPLRINLEQTSSELTAKYKAGLIRGSSMADITGGFGVDSYFFSEIFQSIDHFEQLEDLSKIASHNFDILGKRNIQSINTDGLEGIKNKDYDLIYADPSRRTSTKRKVFLLEDCTPDIVENTDYLLSRAENLIIKTSPMLDISMGINSLRNVIEIHIVAVNNEVKELLFLLTSETTSLPKVVAVNLSKDSVERFEFSYGTKGKTHFGNPETYLYEPNAAILKSGGYSVLSEKYGVRKLHEHSHLFTSDEPIDFPGRRFRIKKIVPYNKKEMKSGIDFENANVTVRNFPESVEIIRKKWKIKEGGDMYVFFTTVADDRKMMLVCEKLVND